MKIDSHFDELRLKIKSHLADFLEENGVYRSKSNENMFRCINPNHDDSNPSMSVFSGKDGVVYHCFACLSVGDIFVANHIINGAPLFGYEFVKDNFAVLAKRYGYEFTPRQLTQEEIEELNIRTAYSMVRDIIVHNFRFGVVSDVVKKYIQEKQISQEEDAERFNIGYVPSWKSLKKDLMDKGLSEKYLSEIGLGPQLFNENNLIFATEDTRGRVCGFAARNCAYDPGNPDSTKYRNSSENILYSKRNLLYNLRRALRKNVSKFNSIYISEGYTDAITSDKAGLRICAIGGTKFTHEHIALLQKEGATDIVFILDGDTEGVRNTARAITEVMEGIRNFRVRIVTLPDPEDPDSFIRKFGIDALIELPHISAFEWRLRLVRSATDLDPYEIASQMVPLIVNESSALERDKMCKQVANACDLDIAIIRKEVAAIANSEQIKAQQESEAVIDNLIKSLRSNPKDVQLILSEGIDTIKNLNNRNNSNPYDENECLRGLTEIKALQEDEENKSVFYFDGMPTFERSIYGNISQKLLLFGGQPKQHWALMMEIIKQTPLNAGKSNLDNQQVRLNNQELWLNINNFKKYEVSSLGRVRNKKTQQILYLKKDNLGYYSVGLYSDGKRTWKRVHRLMAEAFLDVKDTQCVNHIDGDKTNNSIKNLEVCDYSHNLKHAYSINLRKIGDEHHLSRKYILQDINGKLISEYSTSRELCEALKISKDTVGDYVKSGKPFLDYFLISESNRICGKVINKQIFFKQPTTVKKWTPIKITDKTNGLSIYFDSILLASKYSGISKESLKKGKSNNLFTSEIVSKFEYLTKNGYLVNLND